ncbi:hypothetical protein J2W24_004716 [Variovorax boronicumulans]|uniref:hypothetical protein n=1 Tax=Variovorax boronicumulans TaxID=436515 RepID=UPI002789F10B|nr:hypothetical protein [Variovorax boronicumulans]MDP9919047.1 hypothetical protein [Variovorax boronicumulans]
MLHRLYCSSGNTVGVGEYVCYSEIGADGSWVRYVEIKADGTALRYDTERAADQYEILPEGKWDEAESTMSEHGAVAAIPAKLFQAIRSVTRCINDERNTDESRVHRF